MSNVKFNQDATITALKHEVDYLKTSRDEAWAKRRELLVFLENILEIDPTLDQFRRDQPSGQYVGASHRVWDIEGVKAAKDFNKAQALAARYTEQEIALRRKHEAKKASEPAASAVKGRVL